MPFLKKLETKLETILNKNDYDAEAVEEAFYAPLYDAFCLKTALRREVLSHIQYENTPYQLFISDTIMYSSDDRQQIVSKGTSLARSYFGWNAPISFYGGALKVVTTLYDTPNAIGLVPVIDQPPSDGWWLKLLLKQEKPLRIFAKLTNLNVTYNPLELYALSSRTELCNGNISIIAVETDMAVSKAFLKEHLAAHQLPVKQVCESMATYTGKCIHFIEINRPIDNNDIVLQGLCFDIDGVHIDILKKLGSYHTSLPQPDEDA